MFNAAAFALSCQTGRVSAASPVSAIAVSFPSPFNASSVASTAAALSRTVKVWTCASPWTALALAALTPETVAIQAPPILLRAMVSLLY